MRTILAGLALASVLAFAAPAKAPDANAARMKKAFRKSTTQYGWIFVHLEGSPSDIGYQHGYLLSSEIADAERAIKLTMTHDNKDWQFFRNAAQNVLWPHVEAEYRAELQGIVDGLTAKGVQLDLWDVVTMNAWLELDPYYTKFVDKASKRPTGDHCSAFAATGSYTRDGRPVLAHNNWTDYMTGSRWNMIFDIAPASGNRFIMDGMPGLIHSGDDFGLNSAGIMITETTITGFHGFDPNGTPEFVRARKAMQYSKTIDDFARIMKDGNNGGYANDWLIADRNTGEIASLELGLKHVNLWRSKDGYFAGSNYPIDPALAKDETDFDLKDDSNSANARHHRWDDLMRDNRGKIDVNLGKRFLADHYDTFDKKMGPSERTLCGHIDLSERGSKGWQAPFAPAGAVQNKIATAAMADQMTFLAAMGHSCGISFKSEKFLEQHKDFVWEAGVLRDLDSHPWTTFKIAK
jgi:Phospholipase B